MPASDPAARSRTADLILDLAERLIQTRGYSAISYNDIAPALGVTKASVHYHFPSKADLGVAVIDRYVERMGAGLAALAADPTATTLQLLDRYAEPYLKFAGTPDMVCLSGALAGEILVLPPMMKTRVTAFFEQHQRWLAEILTRGRERGEFTLPAPAAQTARMMVGALQGALLIKRTTGDPTQLTDALAVFRAQLAPIRAKRCS